MVEGYGVYLTLRQLDKCNAQRGGSGTKVLRNLLMVFFTPAVLGASSCFGGRKYPSLNQDIVGACLISKLKKI